MAFVNFEWPETLAVSVPLREDGFMEAETTRDAWTHLMPS